MRAPDFYFESPGRAAMLLKPLGALYGAIAAARMRRAGARADIPVFCVGNPTLGGAGKTPTALALANILAAIGERPAFLSRGYDGRAAGPLVVDIDRHTARAVGDEPLLLARAFPTIVGRDRIAGAKLAAAQGASVLVLDDGFQNPSLQKDCSLLVVDGASGIGNGLVFPAGPLRAPLEAQLKQAHAVVCVGTVGAPADPVLRRATAMQIPVLAARLVPEPGAVLASERVLAFAGIGRPEKFFATLAEIGADVVEERSYPDHHRYSAPDAHALLATADARSLKLVTTEKDLVRMKGERALSALAQATKSLPVRLRFDDDQAVRKLLQQALARARR